MATQVYKVYVLRSLRQGRLYVGMSSCVEKRLIDHNAGRVTATKPYRPYKLVYQETVGTSLDARKREKELKSGQGRKFLGRIIPP